MLSIRGCVQFTSNYPGPTSLITPTCTYNTQGAAPKKPYNPVLGEVFRCYWDIPGGKRTPPNSREQVWNDLISFVDNCSEDSFLVDVYIR